MLVFSSLWCVVSSFDINVDIVSFGIFTAVFTIGFALVSSLINSKKNYAITISIVFALILFVLLFCLNLILEQLSYTINCILNVYSQYLPLGNTIYFVGGVNANATLMFIFLSLVLTAIYSIFLFRINLTFPIAILSIVTVLPCFVIIDTVPSLIALFILISILLSLLVSAHIRKHNPRQSGVFTAVSIVIIFSLLLAVNAVFPMKDYERYDWQTNLLTYVQEMTGIVSNDGKNHILAQKISTSYSGKQTQEDLSQIGPKEQTNEPVLRVKAQHSGPTYLKRTAFADYNNNTWSTLSKEEAENYPANATPFVLTNSMVDSLTEDKLSNMSIVTLNSDPLLLTPYYLDSIPDKFSELGDVWIENEDELKAYDLEYKPYNINNINYIKQGEATNSYRQFVYDTYLQLPESTYQDMSEILSGMLNSSVLDVQQMVSASANYSLDTPKIPDGVDAATWLLTSSDEGYCIHFATTATVMLRTLGIPARYVTGYYFNARNDEYVTVSSDNAHAWVEYFDDNIGWVPLEATPSSFSPIDYVEPETTVPITTESVTVPTQPTTSTQSKNNKSNQNFGTINTIVLILIIIVLLVAAIILRRKIVLKSRGKHFTTGKVNTQAIYVYRYLSKLKHFSHSTISDEIADIATKAKFSNHTIDSEELKMLFDYTTDFEKEVLKNSSFIKKLYLKFFVVTK